MKKILSLLQWIALGLAPFATSAQEVVLEDPLSIGGNPFVLYGRLTKAFVGICGAVALFFFVQGGFRWLTSGGNEEKIKKGKDTLVWATLGLAVILGSYFFISLMINILRGSLF